MENCFWPQEGDGSWTCSGSHDSSPMSRLLHGEVGAAAPQYRAGEPFEGVVNDRTGGASRTHSEAEKRRRSRINAQLSTLRKLIPMSEKMDKAGLLAQVVDHVKEQSKRAKEASQLSAIPTETDEVIIDHLNAEETTPENDETVYMKASICCNDRPELYSDLNGALNALGITIVQAEVTCLGGRMKSNFVVRAKGGSTAQNSSECSIKQSLRLALSHIVVSSEASSGCARSKRQRFFHPYSH